MSELKNRLHADLTDAMRARDELTTATLRMALTAVTNAEVAGNTAKELSDAEVVGALQREAKKRREAAEAYDGAGRPELAQRERAELAVVEGYLPAAMSDAELEALVAAAVAAVATAGATGPKAMGQVMKALQPQVAGRADGAAVAARVRAALAAD
ncbi:MAG TPA: GatB/YqeY domain-containing protein [Actinomycetes bacterium]